MSKFAMSTAAVICLLGAALFHLTGVPSQQMSMEGLDVSSLQSNIDVNSLRNETVRDAV